MLRYIFHIQPHFSIFFYCEVVSKRILIFFAPEEAEIFKDYLFISNQIFSKKYFKAISGQIFMKFISRHAEFFEFYLFI
jgi:hypothetical protein